MILVDTSIWIDHLRAGNTPLMRLLDAGLVLCHPWVVGEIALGHLERRGEVLGLLSGLPQAVVATDGEVLTAVTRHDLAGRGIGYVDAQLLAATFLSPGAQLWTRDKRLASIAIRLGCGARPG